MIRRDAGGDGGHQVATAEGGRVTLHHYANLVVIDRESQARRRLDAHAPPALGRGASTAGARRAGRTGQRISGSQWRVLGA